MVWSPLGKSDAVLSPDATNLLLLGVACGLLVWFSRLSKKIVSISELNISITNNQVFRLPGSRTGFEEFRILARTRAQGHAPPRFRNIEPITMRQVRSGLALHRQSLLSIAPIEPQTSVPEPPFSGASDPTNPAPLSSVSPPLASLSDGEADSNTRKMMGVSFTFDSEHPCWVQLFWGVSASALAQRSDGILKTDAPSPQPASELRQRKSGKSGSSSKRKDKRKNRRSTYTELDSLDSPLRDKRYTAKDEIEMTEGPLPAFPPTTVVHSQPSPVSGRVDPAFLDTLGIAGSLQAMRTQAQYFTGGTNLTYTSLESEFFTVDDLPSWSEDSSTYPLAIVIHVDTKAANGISTLPTQAQSPGGALGQETISITEETPAGSPTIDHGLYQITAINFPRSVSTTETSSPSTSLPSAVVLKQVLCTESNSHFEQQDIFGLEALHDSDEQDCPICMSEIKDVILLPCRHLCVCSECVTKIENCPLCREVFTSHVQFQGLASGAGSSQEGEANVDTEVV